MRTLALLLLLSPAVGLAQVVVDLEPEPLPLDSVDFYVASVFDVRPDTATIGTAKTGMFNTKRSAVLPGGAAAAVLRYLRERIPARADAEPIAIRIERLQVSEYTAALQEYGRAEVQMSFHRLDGDEMGWVFEGGAYAERTGLDVTGYHGGNLRDALNEVIDAFASSNWRSVDPLYVDIEDAVEPLAVESPSAAPPPPSKLTHRTMYMLSPLVGRNGVGAGFTYNQYRVGAGWRIPYSFSFAMVGAENPDKEITGLFTNMGPSLGALRRFGTTPLAMMIEAQIPIGTETINYGDEKETNFFVGGRLSQNLLLLPQNSGVFVGVGLYQGRIFGSDLYPSDLGFQFHLGFQN